MYYKIIDNQNVTANSTVQATLKNAVIDTIIIGFTQSVETNMLTLTNLDSCKFQLIKRSVKDDKVIVNCRISDILRYTDINGGNYKDTNGTYMQGFLDVGDIAIGLEDEIVANVQVGNITLDKVPKVFVFAYRASKKVSNVISFESFALNGSASFKNVISIINFTDAAGNDLIVTDNSLKQVIVNDKLGTMVLNTLTFLETNKSWSLIYSNDDANDITIQSQSTVNLFIKKVLE